ncbi:beta-glucosidase 17-like isoform X1 [Pistacia vera]|uniref:beta-glucosidase 17-like isoform X1 n=1 Tax=Pistacia vera TaxID=55513 RepID=UPI0012634CAB|nr:beta-glucosidase 17-like isoform X1 [Pistacia vera]
MHSNLDMKIQNLLVTSLLALTFLLPCIQSLKPCHYSTVLNRSSFPAGFLFGAGSSAYQSEGAAYVDGKTRSIWDSFVIEHPGKISDHSNGDVADEFYYLYKEDVAAMKEIGLDTFKFSISWPRVLPKGTISGGANWKGVDFYNSLINELISNGIEPFVTIFHWDLPQVLEDEYGGFLSPQIVNDFRDYADFCFREFGDRVKYWITLNEPNLYSKYGYATGEYAPGRCSNYIGNCTEGNSATEPYLVTHHMILSHATAANLYGHKYKASQKGIIGITVNTEWQIPKYQTVSCRKAALRALDFKLGWIVHPLTFGDYPKTMRNLVGNRLPNFTDEQTILIKGSLDFVGVNYYTTRYAEKSNSSSSLLSYTTDSHVNDTVEKNGIPIGELAGGNWIYMYPRGLGELSLYVKREYNLPIYITENGMADANNSSLSVDEALDDSLRITYLQLHLSDLLQAIQKGADVRGYSVWSFLDDFEWASGYTLRFGFTYVDYSNGVRRYLKKSALWYKKFLQKKNVTTHQSSLLFSV